MIPPPALPPPQHQRMARVASAVVPAAARPERSFTGIPIAPGVAIGPVFEALEPKVEVTRHKIQAADTAAEGARFDAAIAQSRKQLGKLRVRLAILPEESQQEIAPLIDAYIRMIGPSRLVRGIRRRIDEMLLAAESAVVEEAEAIAGAIQAQAEPGMSAEDRAGLARRAEEVREIGRRLVRNLTHAPFRNFAGLPAGAVLITEALRPADAALLDPSRLAGVAAEEGGADGHTGVMLRAVGVPAVLGAAGLAHAIRPGDVRRGQRDRRQGGAEPLPGHSRRRPLRRHRFRRRTPALCPAAPAAGRDARRRRDRAGRQPGTAARAAADRPVRRPRHRPAALRIPVHEPRNGARRGQPDGELSYHRRGDGRRHGHHPHAGLGRRKGNRGAGGRRHRARDRRRQPGAGSARHPPAAAPAGAVRDPARRHPARRPDRPGACAAAHGHHTWARFARRAKHTNGWRDGCGDAASGCRTSCRRSAS